MENVQRLCLNLYASGAGSPVYSFVPKEFPQDGRERYGDHPRRTGTASPSQGGGVGQGAASRAANGWLWALNLGGDGGSQERCRDSNLRGQRLGEEQAWDLGRNKPGDDGGTGAGADGRGRSRLSRNQLRLPFGQERSEVQPGLFGLLLLPAKGFFLRRYETSSFPPLYWCPEMPVY